MTVPWQVVAPLDAEVYAHVRRRTIFDCCKWDPQVEDVATLASFPIVLDEADWAALRMAAVALYHETLAAEAEVLATPSLHRHLGLPGCIRTVLGRAARVGAARAFARLMRFDFHLTTDGWRVSEVNSDVPGGFIEASGFTRLVAAHYPGLASAGDPADALAEAVRAAVGPDAFVALVHATAYTDDRQVMVYLAGRLAARGVRPMLTSPADLRWVGGHARLADGPLTTSVDAIVRFYPAEWLPNLPRSCGWSNFFAGGCTPQCNPATALLSQSKRVPLVWDKLRTDMPVWRRMLPETRSPRLAERGWNGHWVLKPALGRVGDSIGISGVTPPKEWRRITRHASWHPGYWIAQRRFVAVPLPTTRGPTYPCVGVFVMDGRVTGAYGRIATRPLINELAQDAAVLIHANGHTPSEKLVLHDA